ncbi:unnamed protein product, partial [Vitis vinifera]|uniref:Uncharacterized protein n=1 Tax=Vitis vinifera TaxID=29760 RepID=D7SYF7_VITVI
MKCCDIEYRFSVESSQTLFYAREFFLLDSLYISWSFSFHLLCVKSESHRLAVWRRNVYPQKIYNFEEKKF